MQWRETERGTDISVEDIIKNSLSQYIKSLCHQLYAVDYQDEFEYDLWSFLQGNGRGRLTATFGTEEYEANIKQMLNKYVEGCNGWFRMSPLSNDLEFIPMEEWLEMYESKTGGNQ